MATVRLTYMRVMFLSFLLTVFPDTTLPLIFFMSQLFDFTTARPASSPQAREGLRKLQQDMRHLSKLLTQGVVSSDSFCIFYKYFSFYFWFGSECPMSGHCKVIALQASLFNIWIDFFQDVSEMMQDFEHDLTSLPTLSYRAKDLKSIEVAHQHQ